MTTRSHARAVAAALVAASLALPGASDAAPKKSYINTFTLVLDFTDRAMTWVEKHRDDPRLAEAAAAMARTNVLTVETLSPPPEFVDMHPYFVSIVENSVNAFQAIADDDSQAFYKIKGKMKKDRQSLNKVLADQNFVFPAII